MSSGQRGSLNRRRARRADLLEQLDAHRVEIEAQTADLREAQGALADSLARYADLYHQAPIGYCSLDARGVIVEINQLGARLLNRPRTALVGGLLRMMFPAESRAALDEHLRACLRHGQRSIAQLSVSAGRSKVVEVISVPSRSPGDTIVGCLTTLSDITERVGAEAERARLLEEANTARARAELATRMKDDFLAMVAHELRSPVSTMLLWTHLVREKGGDPVFRREALDAMELSTKTELKLLGDLLDLARLRTGKLQVDRSPVPLAPLIERLVAAATPLAAASGVRLRASLAGDSGIVEGDEIRLTEIVGNLINNSIKFSPSGSEVLVRAAASAREATITIEDKGRGIAPDALPHVFDLFQQEGAPFAGASGGLGVGLAVVKELVEAHGGRVEAASPGLAKGTTVTVTLPLVDRPSPPPTETRAAGRPTPSPPDRALAGVEVLLVEDDDEMRSVVSQVLSLHGANVAAARGLTEGRSLLFDGRPQVLVSDIRFPDGEGYSLVRELRESERGRRTPALALTSLAGAREQALEAGFDRYLTKPVAAETLVSCISQLVAPQPRIATGPAVIA